MTAQSRLESPWSKSSHILNNVSVWTVESKHTRITSNTGSADLRVFKNAGLLQSGSQTNQGTSKDQTIESQTLSGGTFRVFREKPRCIFARFWNWLFQSGENSREIPTAKPRDTFHLSSASLRPYFCDYSTFASPYLEKISLKSPRVVYSKIKKNPPNALSWIELHSATQVWNPLFISSCARMHVSSPHWSEVQGVHRIQILFFFFCVFF